MLVSAIKPGHVDLMSSIQAFHGKQYWILRFLTISLPLLAYNQASLHFVSESVKTHWCMRNMYKCGFSAIYIRGVSFRNVLSMLSSTAI